MPGFSWRAQGSFAKYQDACAITQFLHSYTNANTEYEQPWSMYLPELGHDAPWFESFLTSYNTTNQELRIDNNKLIELDQTIGDKLSKLRILDLRNNELPALPASVSKLQQLVELNLNGTSRGV